MIESIVLKELEDYAALQFLEGLEVNDVEQFVGENHLSFKSLVHTRHEVDRDQESTSDVGSIDEAKDCPLHLEVAVDAGIGTFLHLLLDGQNHPDQGVNVGSQFRLDLLGGEGRGVLVLLHHLNQIQLELLHGLHDVEVVCREALLANLVTQGEAYLYLQSRIITQEFPSFNIVEEIP